MVNIRDLKHFHQHQYARHLVLKTQNVEIIMVCWLPGQGSPAHGHGPSDAVMMILEGEMAYTNFYPDGRKVSGIWRPGDIGHAPVGVQHQISNHSDSELVTLHIYSPPLQAAMQGFDLGYANDVQLQEVQLPQEIVQYLMANPLAQAQPDGVPEFLI